MNSKPMILFIILLVGCFPQVSSDIYAPALPLMAASLGVQIDSVQMSMAIFMAGYAVSQLLYGPLSEGFGRRPALILGLSIAFIGSIFNVLATSIEWLLIGRLIQGLGVGTCALFRTILRDAFTNEEMAKYTSYLVIFITFVIPAAPALGAYLTNYLGWRSVFVFLNIYAITAVLVTIFVFKETSQYHHRDRLKLSFMRSAFKELLSSRVFWGYVIPVLVTYGAFFSWIVATPVLLIQQLGLSKIQYGWITFLGTSSVMALSGFLNGRLVVKYGGQTMMRMGWAIMTIAGSIMLAGFLLVGMNVYVIVGPMVLFYLGSFFIWPNAAVGAFSPFGEIAGYAGSLYGFMQISGGAIVAVLVSHLPEKNQLPLALVVLGCSVLAWLSYEVIGRPAIAAMKAIEEKGH